jgi:hypothetical protein
MASPGSKGVPSKVAVSTACAMMMWLEPVMLRVQGMVLVAPACVMFTMREILHPAMVRVALRDWVEVLAIKLTLIMPLLLPDVGVTVAQAGAPLTVQALQLLVTEILAEPAAAGWLMVAGLTSNVTAAPACVIVHRARKCCSPRW